ncbi:MAG: hypothetical protein SFY70_09175 [Bacteroidia bacterium]|nr:hypothetical protein [Bacteroidia bacterium]
MRRLSLLASQATGFDPLLTFLEDWPDGPIEVECWLVEAAPVNAQHIGQSLISHWQVTAGGELLSEDHAHRRLEQFTKGKRPYHLLADTPAETLGLVGEFADAILVSLADWLHVITPLWPQPSPLFQAPIFCLANPRPPQVVVSAAQIGLVKQSLRFRVLRNLPWLLFSAESNEGSVTKRVLGYVRTYTPRVSYVQLGNDCRERLPQLLPSQALWVVGPDFTLPCGSPIGDLVVHTLQIGSSFLILPSSKSA